MIIEIGNMLDAYLREAFLEKFDLWLAFGLAAQLLFAARFLVQWI